MDNSREKRVFDVDSFSDNYLIADDVFNVATEKDDGGGQIEKGEQTGDAHGDLQKESIEEEHNDEHKNDEHQNKQDGLTGNKSEDGDNKENVILLENLNELIDGFVGGSGVIDRKGRDVLSKIEEDLLRENFEAVHGGRILEAQVASSFETDQYKRGEEKPVDMAEIYSRDKNDEVYRGRNGRPDKNYDSLFWQREDEKPREAYK